MNENKWAFVPKACEGILCSGDCDNCENAPTYKYAVETIVDAVEREYGSWYDEELGMIKEMGERQTPKKVVEKQSEYNECPVCGKNVGRQGNYCRWCGQRLER